MTDLRLFLFTLAHRAVSSALLISLRIPWDEWLLFLKLPDYAARKKPPKKPDIIQLPLAGLEEELGQQASGD